MTQAVEVAAIPVVEERLVVERKLVLVEEIHVVRRTRTATEDVPVTLRSERAEIEREQYDVPEGAGR
ncbi:MAG TPA: DUF2382 domain-containing protein [Allosphingosinicella sp.]|nr:DUF2382 domain-containing protein [Allosphingosinicella sp.]